MREIQINKRNIKLNYKRSYFIAKYEDTGRVADSIWFYANHNRYKDLLEFVMSYTAYWYIRDVTDDEKDFELSVEAMNDYLATHLTDVDLINVSNYSVYDYFELNEKIFYIDTLQELFRDFITSRCGFFIKDNSYLVVSLKSKVKTIYEIEISDKNGDGVVEFYTDLHTAITTAKSYWDLLPTANKSKSIISVNRLEIKTVCEIYGDNDFQALHNLVIEFSEKTEVDFYNLKLRRLIARIDNPRRVIKSYVYSYIEGDFLAREDLLASLRAIKINTIQDVVTYKHVILDRYSFSTAQDGITQDNIRYLDYVELEDMRGIYPTVK